MLQFEVKNGIVTRAIIVDSNHKEICGALIAPWANKMDVADVLIKYVRNNGIYQIPERSSRC